MRLIVSWWVQGMGWGFFVSERTMGFGGEEEEEAIKFDMMNVGEARLCVCSFLWSIINYYWCGSKVF